MPNIVTPDQPREPSYAARLLAARARATQRRTTLESAVAEAALPPGSSDTPHPDEVLQRVKDVMSHIPADEIVDPAEYERALALFLEQADRTLHKARADVEALDTQDRITLEAVIRTDGTRPSLLVRNNQVDAEHPLAVEWRDHILAAQHVIRDCSKAIGRIQPAGGSANNFYGTGWLVKKIDDHTGLVLTNNHVLDEMRAKLPQGSLTQSGATVVVHNGAAVIDFVAEAGSLEEHRFNIVEATPTPVPGRYFAYFDAAVLKIERIAGQAADLPEPIRPVADVDGPLGNFSSFCLIGYPAKPAFQSGLHGGVDWTWVTNTLFGGRFGVKRLAPGAAHRPLGTVVGDGRKWVFGHDATTLGGNSGSPVIAWKDGGFGFGLHFAGTDTESNFAHAIAQCVDQLETLGLNFS